MSPDKEPLPNAQLQLLQANERTVLAWIRTGLAIMALGFVVARIGLWMKALHAAQHTTGWSTWIGIGFMLLGMATHLLAAQRYLAARNAILNGESAMGGRNTVLFVTFALTILGAILIAALTTSHL